MRYQRGGFISDFYNPLEVPDAPTIGTATAGDGSASVTFTAPSDVGGSAITEYGAVSTPGGITGTSASSPVTVAGLTNGTSYTFQVWAINSYGPSAYSGASGSVTPAQLQRGIFAGGYTGSYINVISYISISSTGNATYFGDLTVNVSGLAGASSSTRGVFGGGTNSPGGNQETNVIGYITIATTGNATDFGDLATKRYALTACSNNSRALFAGGYSDISGSRISSIDYITIATTGNATNFGNLYDAVTGPMGCASPTRGLFAGGYTQFGSRLSTIGYVTIASTGNTTSFGDLTEGRFDGAACSSSTRGVFAGGYITTNTIDYVTIASTGNATDFGDLTVSARSLAGTSSETRGVFGGGTSINVIQYITIASTGNATDFGDLLSSTGSLAACSNCYGGVQ